MVVLTVKWGAYTCHRKGVGPDVNVAQAVEQAHRPTALRHFFQAHGCRSSLDYLLYPHDYDRVENDEETSILCTQSTSSKIEIKGHNTRDTKAFRAIRCISFRRSKKTVRTLSASFWSITHRILAHVRGPSCPHPTILASVFSSSFYLGTCAKMNKQQLGEKR